MLFEVINSGYFDVTITSGADAAGMSADAVPAYGGGSPAGYGIGNTYDLTGFNTAFGAGVNNNGSNVMYASGYLRNSVNNANGNFAAATGRHSDGANYLMTDGHAKYLRASSVSGGYENPTAGDCGSTAASTAATTSCSDKTIVATFNVL